MLWLAAILSFATSLLFPTVLPSTCRVQRKLSTSFWRASPWFFNVGRAIKTWLYMGMYAVLRRSARCSRSVGGVVANILLLRAFGSICRIVSVTVSCMFLPRYSPKCLMCSGVSIPSSRNPAVTAGDVFMQRACDFLMLMFRPLTCWYSLYSCSRGRTSSALERRRGFRLSSANRIGPTLIPPSVLYIKFLLFWAMERLRGSVASRKRILERGSPWPDPVLMVMTRPFLPLTST